MKLNEKKVHVNEHFYSHVLHVYLMATKRIASV